MTTPQSASDLIALDVDLIAEVVRIRARRDRLVIDRLPTDAQTARSVTELSTRWARFDSTLGLIHGEENPTPARSAVLMRTLAQDAMKLAAASILVASATGAVGRTEHILALIRGESPAN